MALKDVCIVQVAGTDAEIDSVLRSHMKSGGQENLHRLYRNAGFESPRPMELLKRSVMISDSCKQA